MSSLVPFALLLIGAAGATLSGTVSDPSGKPIQDARVDHTGKITVVAATTLHVPPSPGEIRTDADGAFRVVTDSPAIVIRKPGYESQRIFIGGDERVHIVLKPMKAATLCKLSPPPIVKTKAANDVDYSATWFYIKTKTGPKGILSGHGSTYSFGAPSNTHVWESTEYYEVMSESGMVDASGHSTDGKYWRERSIFGAAAQYYNQTREDAEQLDCVMDRVLIR